MSGTKINNFSIGDSNIESLMLATDELFVGFHKVSLTNYNTTDESQVAAGSIVECAGALYKFSSNESITGSPSDGTVYIRIVPDTTTCTLEYTNTAPTWSDTYQGWYGAGGAALYRYIFSLNKASTVWISKKEINSRQAKIEIPVYMNTGETAKIVNHGISSAKTSRRVVSITPIIYGSTYYGNITGSGDAPQFFYVTDTEFQVVRATSLNPITFYTIIEYI